MSPMVKRPYQLENVLLGFLNREPQHGYSIHQQFATADGLGRIWQVKQSQLYALLDKLEAAGYVHSTLQPQEPHPARRVFSISPTGRRIYTEWVVSPVRLPHQVRQEFLAKLYFARLDGWETCRALISAQQDCCRDWRLRLEGELAALDNRFSFDRLVLEYRLAQVDMIRSFLERVSKFEGNRD